MKIKFNSNDDLTQNKKAGFHNIAIAVRSVFHKKSEYYVKVFLNECLYKLWMLYFDRTYLFEGIYVDVLLKTSASKECIIYHYQYFLDKCIEFQQYIFNGCHNILMMCLNLTDTTILNICSVDYCCIINWISKIEAVNLFKNADLTKNSGTL